MFKKITTAGIMCLALANSAAAQGAAGTGTGAVVEAGVLNASSGGTLLCRTVFAVVNKGAADTLKITWTVTVADS